VDLIPKFFVAGLFTPPPDVPGGAQVTIEKINHIWSEITPRYGYRQFQMAPDGASAQFLGASQEEAVVIQPPLLQVRDPIHLAASKSAEKAEDILKVVARHLGVTQFFNLAVRHIAWAPAPDHDARAFLLNRLSGKTEDDLGELVGGGEIWTGQKFVVDQEGSHRYTLILEPLQADASFIFIDLDAQFPGPLTSLDSVADRAEDANTYLTHAVSRYLDKH
jgi:hypothetical protein